MADYFAFPLWIDAPPGCPGPVSTDSLPVSAGLRQRLRAWAHEYDTFALSKQWPALVNDWNQRGLDLSNELANEVGEEWDVVYFDELTAAEVAIPFMHGDSKRA